MSYYTYYKLKMWNEEGDELTEAAAKVVKLNLAKIMYKNDEEYFGSERYAKKVTDDLCDYGREIQWQNDTNDIRELAEQYPHIKFELEGNGEDGTDWWVGQFWGVKYDVVCAERPIPHIF